MEACTCVQGPKNPSISDHPCDDLTHRAELHLRNSQTVFCTVWAVTCGTRCNCTTRTSTTICTASGESLTSSKKWTMGICLIAMTGKSTTNDELQTAAPLSGPKHLLFNHDGENNNLVQELHARETPGEYSKYSGHHRPSPRTCS